MKRKELYADMQAKIDARLAELRQYSFSDLTEMPEYFDDPHMFGKWKYTIATWRDRKSDNLVQIVVQAYCPWILGIGTMMADGFRMQRDGMIVEVPQDERYEFT